MGVHSLLQLALDEVNNAQQQICIDDGNEPASGNILTTTTESNIFNEK